MKSTLSLDARIFDRGNNINPPIAPPRKKRVTLKKRSTLPSKFPTDDIPNGFKEVFGTNISPNNIDSLDFIDNEENSLQERSMMVDDERTSSPERKLKIGNKKSDKFFGESLSDHLSDEPVAAIEISKVVEHPTDDSKHNSDKNLSSFLMNMLDDIRNAEDEEKYKGQIPVEEPPFVVRKRETKHICDDDTHKHDHAPPKPDRDFTKFKAGLPNIDDEIKENLSIEKAENVQAKVRVKRGISRENLPSPPATPNRKKCIINSTSTPEITIKMSDSSVDTEALDNVMKNEESQKLNELQNDENITTDLVDMVINKAYGMSDFNYHPEDFSHHTHNDGSNLVTPTSKLAVRKISTPRKISTESAPLFDNEMINEQINNKTSSSVHNDSIVIENDDKAFVTTENAVNKLEENVHVSSNVNDIIDEMYNKNTNIIQEFQSFLEQSIEKEPMINVDEEKKFLDSKGSLDENMDDHIKKINEDEFDDRSYSDSFESTDEDLEAESKKVILSAVDVIKTESDFDKRRESIEDVDNWFCNHIEMDQKESDVCNSYVGENRSSLGYDTKKIFPFGSISERRDSQSDEFFTDISSGNNQRMKQHIDPAQKVENSILEEDETRKEENEQKIASEKRESSPDHSTLLKFLEKKHTTETNEQN